MSKSFTITPAASAMRELKALAATPISTPAPRPSHLSLEQITVRSDLFQPRQMSEQHSHALSKIIKAQGQVSPIVIWPAGDKLILIDGHHRLRAYEQSGKMHEIPVEYFEGTIEAALAKSGELNTPLKLQMTTTERQDFAWKLVTLGEYSKSQIVTTSGASLAQVARMRAAKITLGALAHCFDRWPAARKHADGKKPDDTFDPEEWKEQQAEEYAERLTRAFNNKLSTNPEVAAMAFRIYFGRRLPDLYRFIREDLSEGELAEIEEDDDDR